MEHRVKTFFGRRKGRALSNVKEELLSNRMKEFELALPLGASWFPKAHGDPCSCAAPMRPLDARKLGKRQGAGGAKLTLEIGYGSGEHLVEYAKKRPDEFFIGTEAFENGNAAMVRALVESGLENVKIYPHDANLLFPLLPDSAFDRIFILYPDPWPKSRHEERRMISPERLKTFARLLKKGGRLLVVSDHPVYIAHTLRVLGENGLFEWTALSSHDFARPPEDWETTRYEQKALREGRLPIYLEFVKK